MRSPLLSCTNFIDKSFHSHPENLQLNSKPQPRVALVTNVLSHYRVACFQQLLQVLPDRVSIFLLADKMPHRHYVLSESSHDLPVTVLNGWHWSKPPYDDLHLNNIGPLISGGYDLIILSGWVEPTYLLLWAWGTLTRKKILFWIESTTFDMPRTGPKEWLKRLLLARAAGCLVPGQRARQYCAELGMTPQRLFVAPNAINQCFFRAQAATLLPQRQRIRQQLKLDSPTVLFVGRLVQRYKDFVTLIRAIARLEQKGVELNLIIAGEGEDAGLLRRTIDKENCRCVRIVGNLNHDQLCRYYAASDLLALPSRSETWGFVLNEGMEFGLPVIVSEAVGAGPDLVHENRNGFVVPVGDVETLGEKIALLLEDQPLRQRMGRASREIVAQFSPEEWAAGVQSAIQAVLR